MQARRRPPGRRREREGEECQSFVIIYSTRPARERKKYQGPEQGQSNAEQGGMKANSAQERRRRLQIVADSTESPKCGAWRQTSREAVAVEKAVPGDFVS
jgi:hypothetical protein